jgi:hypothetical protein
MVPQFPVRVKHDRSSIFWMFVFTLYGALAAERLRVTIFNSSQLPDRVIARLRLSERQGKPVSAHPCGFFKFARRAICFVAGSDPTAFLTTDY